MSKDSISSSRIDKLFHDKKILCFGRYAIEVPLEAEIIEGNFTFGSSIEVFSGNLEKAKILANEEIRKIKRNDDSAETIYNGPGPIPNSWQLRFFNSKFGKEDNFLLFSTYVSKGEFTFVLGDAIDTGETESMVDARQVYKTQSLRLREKDELPVEPGFCIQHGFMQGEDYGKSEQISAGIYFPSFPDITFSVSSNQNAYIDYPKEEFEKMKRDELPLLARIKQAQQIQGALYPKRDVLREGNRDVQHWKGEESLIRRPDGTHDFEWAFVGTPKDVANPSEFRVVMFTKVKNNMVSAAKNSSVTDDEALAIWDKLLTGLKLRVKVPGAPHGSYYLPKMTLDTIDHN